MQHGIVIHDALVCESAPCGPFVDLIWGTFHDHQRLARWSNKPWLWANVALTINYGYGHQRGKSRST